MATVRGAGLCSMSRSRHKAPRRRPAFWGMGAVFVGLAGASVLGLLGRIWWGFDLLSHFRVQYFQLALVALFVTLWRRQPRRAIAWIVLAGFNYAFVLPFYFGSPPSSTRPPVRALLLNLGAGNDEADRVLNAIRSADPDFMVLEEVTPAWAHALVELQQEYPHQLADVRADCFGIMLLSKYPFEGALRELGEAGVPSLVVEMRLPDGVVTVIGTHPLPPISREYAVQRDGQLAALADVAADQTHPVLLIGDLNASSWSAAFRDLLANSGLENSMRHFGFQPSWPAASYFVRIPIDHVLHSPSIRIHQRVVGGAVGSDHFPVIVDFALGS